MLGAVARLLFGSLSDKLGRIRVLSWTILVFAVFTGLCALARDSALATEYSFHAAIGLLASIYILDIIATLFLIPELKDKQLD
jgi:nitrate/nitrite transporter NarK